MTGSSASVLAVAVLILCALPGAVLRCLVALYPADEPRRAELLAEMHAVPRAYRPFWVAAQVETALLDGLPARLRRLRQRRSTRRRLRSDVAMSTQVPMPRIVAVSIMAVFGYWFLFAVTGGFFLLILLLLPFLPLSLLAALAVQHGRRARRTRTRSR